LIADVLGFASAILKRLFVSGLPTFAFQTPLAIFSQRSMGVWDLAAINDSRKNTDRQLYNKRLLLIFIITILIIKGS
jgi:hypothetical protein